MASRGRWQRQYDRVLFGPENGDTFSEDIRREKMIPSATVQTKRRAYEQDRERRDARGIMEERMAHNERMARLNIRSAMGEAEAQRRHELDRDAQQTRGKLELQDDKQAFEAEQAERNRSGVGTIMQDELPGGAVVVYTGNGNASVVSPPVETPGWGSDPTGSGEFYFDGSHLRERGAGRVNAAMEQLGPVMYERKIQQRQQIVDEIMQHEAEIADGDKRVGFLGLGGTREARVKKLKQQLAGIDAVLGGGALPQDLRNNAAGSQNQNAEREMPPELQAALNAAKAAGLETFQFNGKIYRVPNKK
jgi:hypothetical protein